MIYDAFISYRHTPLDMEFAKKVHTGLETYHVPAAVRKKTGKKKIERVFRDQEELPIGSDLNDNISAAIKESEYLIVICSPETPGSYWVNKEIETFIGLHDRHHVLAVLTDGEPEQSFPKLLLTDENGNPVEPLAADVRGATAKERNKKFKTEILRLAAPVLGCTYDDLRQRHGERILKRNIMIASVAAGIIAAAGAAFGIYNAGVAKRMKKLADEKAVLADEKTLLAGEKSRLADEKTKLADEILAEFRDKQENQSRFYAEEAMMLLQQGNREDAALVAAAGLPSEDNDRPFVAEAEYALSAALHVYDCGKALDYERVLTHELSVKSMIINGTQSYMTSIDFGNTVYAWDCRTWSLVCKIPAAVKDNNYRESVNSAFTDTKGILIAYDKDLVRYSFDGKEIARYTFDKKISSCVFSDVNDMVFCIASDTVYILGLSDFTLRFTIQNVTGDTFSNKTSLSADGTLFAVAHYSSEEGRNVNVTVIEIPDPETFRVLQAPVSEEYILNLTVTDNGNVAVVSTNNEFFMNMEALTLDLFRTSDGEKIYSRELPLLTKNLASFTMLIGAHSYEGKSDIVVAADTDAYFYDEMTGEMKAHIPLTGRAITLDLFVDTDTVYIGFTNGEIIGMSSDTGRIYTDNTVDTNDDMDDMITFYGGIAVHRPYSNTILVIKQHKADGLKELPEMKAQAIGVGVAPSSEYYILRDYYNYGMLRFYDRNGNFLYEASADVSATATGFKGDTCVMTSSDAVRLINPFDKTDRRIRFADMGAETFYSKADLSSNGRFLALWGVSGLAVIDLEKETCICKQKDTGIGALAISGDGSRVLISKTGHSLIMLDVVSGTMTEFEDTKLRQVSDSYTLEFLCADDAGKYAAMACEDGYLRIVELTGEKTVQTLPMRVKSICFIGFTKDSKHIIVQDDDYTVRVYDVASGSCVNSYDALSEVVYFVEDDDFIAVCDNANVTLLDAERFGRLAYAPAAAVYLPAYKTFILTARTSAWSAEYKDYKALLAELERQFPGAELTKEKKVAYNVE